MKRALVFFISYILLSDTSLATKKAVIILGAPGSGKGTQVELLKERLDWLPIAPANLRREEKVAFPSFIPIYDNHIKPDARTKDILKIGLVLAKISKFDSAENIVFENWPRTPLSLGVILKLFDKKNLVVVELITKNDLVLNRIANRKQCTNCGMSYGLARREQNENICDDCLALLALRPHDNENDYCKRLPRFITRQSIYRETFKQHNIAIHEINAEGAPLDIHAQIVRLIDEEEKK